MDVGMRDSAAATGVGVLEREREITGIDKAVPSGDDALNERGALLAADR